MLLYSPRVSVAAEQYEKELRAELNDCRGRNDNAKIEELQRKLDAAETASATLQTREMAVEHEDQKTQFRIKDSKGIRLPMQPDRLVCFYFQRAFLWPMLGLPLVTSCRK